jgi:hypothetical protein
VGLGIRIRGECCRLCGAVDRAGRLASGLARSAILRLQRHSFAKQSKSRPRARLTILLDGYSASHRAVLGA